MESSLATRDPSSDSRSRSKKLDLGAATFDLTTEVPRIKTSKADTSCGNVLSTGRLFVAKSLKLESIDKIEHSPIVEHLYERTKRLNRLNS